MNLSHLELIFCTNGETLASSYTPDGDDRNCYDCYLDALHETINDARDELPIGSEFEYRTDSSFQNWNGGKYSHYQQRRPSKVCTGAICCYGELTAEEIDYIVTLQVKIRERMQAVSDRLESEMLDRKAADAKSSIDQE